MHMDRLLEDLRALFREVSVYRLNLVYQDEEEDQSEMTQVARRHEEVTISDWGLRHEGRPLIDSDVEAGTEVAPAIFVEEYRDDITGEVDWNAVRDVIHTRYDHDTKHKAGNAKGCIRRFLFEVEDGDVGLINGTDGTMLAVFTGPARVLAEDTPQRDIDDHHTFVRNIRFLRDENGEVITFDNSDLPKPLKPNQLTITEVKRDDLRTVLTQAEALIALASTASLADD
ncbi:hypothetical protein [Halobellus rufus]|uniref:hypothetical protein n=1 Tax=Halobacteriales TaxID=2235 RepID=UPI000678508D|nr:hypothetical protein [Halobellus rufus]